MALKRLIKQNGIQSRADMKSFVRRDWRTHEFADFVSQGRQKLEYALGEAAVRGCAFPRQQRWKEEKPVSFDNEKPHLWFDNFANIEKIHFNDLEIMQYRDLDVFKMYNHPPMITALKEKSGAPQELAFKRTIYPISDLIRLRRLLDPHPPQESPKVEKKSKSTKKKTEPEVQTTTTEVDEIWDLETQIRVEGTSGEGLYQHFDDFDARVIETSIPEVILDLFEEGGAQEKELSGEEKKRSEMHPTKKSVNLFDQVEGGVTSGTADVLLSGGLPRNGLRTAPDPRTHW